MNHHPNSDQMWEYIESLQQQLDGLVDLDEGRMERIRRLERDRETLRRRLEQGVRRWPVSGRRKAVDEASSAPPQVDPPLHVPGVGTIDPPSVDLGPPARSLRVATVLDEFSSVGFGPEFESVPLVARSWREAVEESGDLDLLFVESAYTGPEGSWATRIARFGKPSPHLAEMVSWFRDRGIPTVFWCKEDPINFDWFIASAGLFDYVFTVDGDTITKYRSILGHDRVHLLQFFAQPRIHHPGPWEQRTGSVAFAGSYYAAKHPERRAQIEALVDPALEFGLHIFDRHAAVDDSRFGWPDVYRDHIIGRLTYLQTVEAYRRYKVFLNVNTVTQSATMCSRRVFELAACGAPILTTRCRAIEVMVPDGALRIVDSASDASRALGEMLGDEGYLKSMAEKARTWVLDGHTSSARVDELLNVVGSGR